MRSRLSYSLLSVGLLWAQLNGIYTIGPGGDYTYISEALNALTTQGISGNVTFQILPSYTGEDANNTNILIVNPYSGMGTYNVTLTVHPSRATVAEIALDPSAVSSQRFVLRFNGIDNFTVDGGPNRLIRFRVGTPDAGLGVIGLIPTGSNPCRNITLRNIEVDGGSKNQTRVGIYLGNAASFPGTASVGGNNNNLIENCWIYRVQEGIILHGNSATNRDVGNIVRGCKIGHANLVRSWGGGGNYRSGIVAAHQDGLRIEQDTIFNAYSDQYYGFTGILVGATAGSSASLPTVAPCVNTHIAGNWIHSIEYAGTGGWDANGIRVYVGSVSNANIFIYNNFIAGIVADGYNNPAGTWNSYGILLQGSSNSNAGIYVYHNTIHLYGTPATPSPPSTSTPSCLAIRSGITGGVYVRNNIFQNTQTPAGSASSNRTTVAIAYEGNSPSVFAQLDNNAYFVNNANGAQYAFVGALGTSRYPSLSAWQTALGGGREQNSLQFSTAFPFVSPTDLHFPLAAAELPLEGGGVFITSPINIATDIDGETRPIGTPTGPDIGADEIAVPPCPSAITAGSLSITPSSIEAGTQSFTITANGTVTHPAEWQISINGGPWNSLQPYTSPTITYTPTQVGTYSFRIVARVARYHQTCPNLQNDTSNVVSGTVTCPSTLSAGTISASVTSQPAGNPFQITAAGPVSLPAQWEDSIAGGSWTMRAPYTSPTYNYTPTSPGTYYVRLAALPPAGCSGSPVYSNVLTLQATATGNTILDPLDITPRDPNRTDTTVNGNNQPPFTNTYTGPGNQPSPDVFYMYVLRQCLDSIRVSTCNSTSFGSNNDLYLHVINISANRRLYTDGGRCGGSTTLWQAALDIFHDPTATGAQNVTSSSGYRAGMRLAANDTLIIVVEGYGSQTGPFVLEVQEFRYNPANQPSLPNPPFFPYDTSRVCWRGGIVRDSLNTGITTPGVQHVWYRNGQVVPGVNGPIYRPSYNRGGIIDTIVVELRTATSSYCAPSGTFPRDTIYVLVDSLPEVRFVVNGSPYNHGETVEITPSGSGNVCVQYSASTNAYTSYLWVINRSTYTGPGPHTECYPSTATRDTIVLVTTNGSCVKRDTLYLFIDRSTSSLSPSRGGIMLYPNPAQDVINILSGSTGGAEVRLYDLRGQLLYQERLYLQAEEPLRWRLPALSMGVYLIEVRQGERLLREPLLIER
ncbi:MAG: T9SS type A sorting domain-containing protein [Bacteroidia bacterium]|nr:T9SS type A sorting domain-containing protein [Bacteroidia bacterium]